MTMWAFETKDATGRVIWRYCPVCTSTKFTVSGDSVPYTITCSSCSFSREYPQADVRLGER